MREKGLLRSYYVQPPYVALEGYTHWSQQGIKTYSEYNYLRPGLSSFLRTRHFEHALRLTREYFHKCNVIDFGCADGPFLPSLAKYFNHVVAIDRFPQFAALASEVVTAAGLENVKVVCNHDLSLQEVKSQLGSEEYHILYLMETLEHMGDKLDPWGSRVRLVKDLFDLIDERGAIVISVPKMVGIPFLVQRLGLFLTRAHREPVSMSNLLRVSFFNDTSGLEKQWQGRHLGFNHRKLERQLRKEFHIHKKKNTLFQIVYLCQRRTIGV